MKPKKLIVATIAILSVVVLVSFLKKDLWDVNEALLKEAILSIDGTVETVKLSDVTPFDWDTVYSFDPYTTKDTIYETVGYKWDRISETVNEGMNQIVFLNEGKVVCYLYGYPENNGYGIFFTNENNNENSFAAILEIEDDLTFHVDRNDDVTNLIN